MAARNAQANFGAHDRGIALASQLNDLSWADIREVLSRELWSARIYVGQVADSLGRAWVLA